jgi:nucleoside-diphosphate-sugar epimerase
MLFGSLINKKSGVVMSVLIVGYGYVGYYLSLALLDQGENVTAWSRSAPSLLSEHGAMRHYKVNCMDENVKLPEKIKTVFYCAPPSTNSEHDVVMKMFLKKQGLIKVDSIVYFSSSGVYGNHYGDWVTEMSELRLTSRRQKIRADTEYQITKFCLMHKINLSILRVAGIYGPNRLPIKKAEAQAPLIRREEAPMVNLIYINDLVNIAIKLAGKVTGEMIFNVSDGAPKPWGETQRIVTGLFNIEPALEVSYADYWQQATNRLQEFLLNNKKLSTEKVRTFLGGACPTTPIEVAINESFIRENVNR